MLGGHIVLAQGGQFCWYLQSGGVKDENIILNISTLINNSAGPVSEQYIASTIIHEIIHAYINNNPTIFNASPSQHLTMLQNYIPTMATALISFYPDLSLADAVSLSLGGLEDLNLSTDASGGSIYNSPTFSSILSSLNTQFQINLNSDPNSRASYQFTASFYQAGGQSGTHCAGGGKVL